MKQEKESNPILINSNVEEVFYMPNSMKRKELDLLLKEKGNKLMLMKDFKDVYEIAILNEGTRMTHVWGAISVTAIILGVIIIKFL